ncbi:MAG: hypothetical protein ACRD8W_07775 [Nitrososphaeraceae archaeon]
MGIVLISVAICLMLVVFALPLNSARAQVEITNLFVDEFRQVTNITGLDFSLIQNKNHSVSFYAISDIDKPTLLKKYANVPALYGPNGVQDVLDNVRNMDINTVF